MVPRILVPFSIRAFYLKIKIRSNLEFRRSNARNYFSYDRNEEIFPRIYRRASEFLREDSIRNRAAPLIINHQDTRFNTTMRLLHTFFFFPFVPSKLSEGKGRRTRREEQRNIYIYIYKTSGRTDLKRAEEEKFISGYFDSKGKVESVGRFDF